MYRKRCIAFAIIRAKNEFEFEVIFVFGVFDRDGFEKSSPKFSFSVKDDCVSINAYGEKGCDGYELYKCGTKRGEYALELTASRPIFDCRVPDGRPYYYKIRAFHDYGKEKVYSKFSECELIDILTSTKKRSEKIEKFFESVKEISDVITCEDVDVLIETIKLAGYEAKERERRRKLEEEARQKRKELEAAEKRRRAAAKRAEARRRKKELEHIESVTRMDLPMDYVNSFTDDDRADIKCENISDGLMLSLDTLGMVDIEFISSVTGKDMKTVIETLRGSIYQNPLYWNEVFYKGWETADEYLSGNLMNKYHAAKEANEKYNGYFQNNVTAIEGILNKDIPVDEIYVTLGSPWVPTDVIDDFIAYMAFGNKLRSDRALTYFQQFAQNNYAVVHDEFTGIWDIPEKTRFRKGNFHGAFEEVNYKTYGTDRMDMLYVLENTLNMKTLAVYDLKNPDDPSCKTRIINQEETVKLLEKQNYMIETFQNWVWSDKKRKERLQSAYCRRYGNIRKRNFDGSFLEFPGMAEDMKLYDYQKNAVARILFSPNTLLAHDVGSGKTFIMIAAGMELRRLGKSKKNLYVVPNNIIGQWEKMFKKMYPDSNILTVSINNFDTKRRSETLNKIKNEDYDAILMTYSCFDMLSLSQQYYTQMYKEMLAMLSKTEKVFNSKASIEKKREKLMKTLNDIQENYQKKPETIPFDELGINTLFVDEAHNYKNVSIESRITRVRGMGISGSERANGMMDKVHCVQRMNDGGRVVFATGTPVTNSLSDIYVMQKYLQQGELEFLGILNFDAWAGMFARKTTEFEIDVDTNSYYLVTRFSKFCNIPELTATLSSIADFHQVDKSAGIPLLEGYSDSLRSGSDDFKEYLREISDRADDIRKKRVTVREDNMLKVTSDGRKAALDMRLIDVAFGLDPDSKVMRCAENVTEVYENTRENKGTQLVFCDISTPKDGFNLYDELRNLLVAMGIPKNEIAFVHSADSDSKRQALFKSVTDGEIAVLIGSTAKMGHGMNVQKRLVAIHHLDVPWRPSDMVQREGRILRQGNENEKVKIFRYITKASFDAYSWQLLETKQRFISQIMSGDAYMREGGDVNDTVLNYAEVKALAVGNPRIKRRVEVCNELDKYIILQNDIINDRHNKERELAELPEKIKRIKERIKNIGLDIKEYAREEKSYKDMQYTEQREIRRTIYNAVFANQNNPEITHVLDYQGFEVVVPAYMAPRTVYFTKEENGSKQKTNKPVYYVNLVRHGTYFLEIESESGITTRLNNFLDDLEKLEQTYKDQLLEYETRLATVKTELEKENFGYADKINALKSELAVLNEELGVA